jgi:hypothetical protein
MIPYKLLPGTPLQGLEAKLTWRVPESSGFQKLQERMSNFYSLKGKMDFHVVGAPVRKGVLCEKLYRVTEGGRKNRSIERNISIII